MTLPSSGGLSIAQILAEIGDSYPVTIPNANWRTLAGKPTGSLVIPTDFYGRSWPCTVTDIKGPSTSGTSHSFSNASFGPDVTGRMVFVFIFGQGKPSATVPGSVSITGWTAGGVGPFGGGTFGFYFRQGGSGNTVFAGVVDAGFQTTGTSGTVSFTTSMATQCSIAVVSTITVVNPNATLTNSVNGNNASATSVSAAVDIPSLGTLLAGGIVNDTGVTTSFTNASKLTSFEHVAGYQCAVAASYPLGVQAGRSVTFSKSGAATAIAIDVDVWQ